MLLCSLAVKKFTPHGNVVLFKSNNESDFHIVDPTIQ